MKFLVDAQLPSRLANLLNAAGHDAVHTSALPDGNRSSDRQVAEAADVEARVVITKDRDFRDTHLIAGTPKKLLIVATGNTSNKALLALFERSLVAITNSLVNNDFLELHIDALVVYERRPEQLRPSDLRGQDRGGTKPSHLWHH